MIQLDEATYKELCAKAKRTEEWEAKEQERHFEMLRLHAENDRLRQKLGLAIRKMFGPSSERRITGQESLLFNEVEAEAVPGAPEPERQVKGYVRGKKKHLGQKSMDLGGVEIREDCHELGEESSICPICGKPMKKIGYDENIKVEVAPIVVTIVTVKQAKHVCSEPDNHPLKTSIARAPAPPTAFPKSMATESAVAHIMHEKYVMGSPLYRLEQEFARLGFPLSRQTMANWVIAGADLLEPICHRLHRHLLKAEALHADESRIQVLNEPGKSPTSQSQMWLYCTGRYSPLIMLYDYQPSRGRDHPSAFLKDFTGYLHVDGYAGYEKLPDITLCGCWAHARRKYIHAIDTLPADKRNQGGTKSHEGLAFCDRLFEIERKLHDATPEERRIGRERFSRIVLNSYKAWLDETVLQAQQKMPLGEAVRYSIRQWTKLTAFMKDGRLEIDNNRAERAIKNFVIGRKNWLFSNTEAGADASATTYSIIETAKVNELDPRKYLEFLFKQIALSPKLTEKQLDELLPWKSLPQKACRVTQNCSETP